MTKEQVYKANDTIKSLKLAVALGEEKYKEFIDIFEPLVQYATYIFLKKR